MVRRGAVIGVAVVSVALLAGCAHSPESPRPATAEEIEALQEEQAREWWESFAGYKPMPEVEVIEALPPNEAFPRQTECLREAEIPGVTFSDDGQWTYEGEPSATNPMFLPVQEQYWICTQQFPAAGDADFILSESELAWLYDFYLTRYRPCLSSLGFQAVGFPGRETFVGDGAGYPSWIPYDYSISPVPTPGQWRLIAERCPMPELLEVYDLPPFG